MLKVIINNTVCVKQVYTGFQVLKVIINNTVCVKQV